MRALLLPLLLIPLMPVKAEEADVQCPGQNTMEMRWCASQQWDESNQALKEQLTPKQSWRNGKQQLRRSVLPPMPLTDKEPSIPRWSLDAMTDSTESY